MNSASDPVPTGTPTVNIPGRIVSFANMDDWEGWSSHLIKSTRRGKHGYTYLMAATEWLYDRVKHAWGDTQGDGEYIDRIAARIRAAIDGTAPPKQDRIATQYHPTPRQRVNVYKRYAVRVTNSTSYDSKLIAAMFHACLKDNDRVPRSGMYDLRVIHTRTTRGGVAGYAYLNSRTLCLKLPRMPRKLAGPRLAWIATQSVVEGLTRRGGYEGNDWLAGEIARVIEHELFHCWGYHHAGSRSSPRMPKPINDCTQHVPWAEGLHIAFDVPQPKVKKSAAQRADDRADHARDKIAAIQKDIVDLERAIRRKQNLITKWNRKLRDAERAHDRAAAKEESTDAVD